MMRESISHNYNEELAETAEQPMSRREFLQIAALAAGTLVIGSESARGEKPEFEMTSKADIEVFRSKYEKIKYPNEAFKELTPELRSLVVEIGKFQGVLAIAIGIKKEEGTILNKPHIVDQMDSAEQLEEKKRTLWEMLRTFKSDLPPYSEEVCLQFLAYDLPRLLAPYGVFAKPLLVPIADLTNDRFDSMEVMVGLHEIERTDSDQTEQWGKTVSRDVVHVRGPLVIDGKPANTLKVDGTAGQTFYQNVIIYRPQLERDITEEGKSTREASQVYKEASQLDWRSALEAVDNPSAFAHAFASTSLLARLDRSKDQEKDHEANIIAHETRHLFDAQSEHFREVFRPKMTTKPSEFFAQTGNASAHEEINGLLGELRYSPSKEHALLSLLSLVPKGIQQDFGHDLAAEWVFREIVKEISKNPARYGMQLLSEGRINISNEITAQFEQLADHPRELEKLAEHIIVLHEQNYQEDFSREYLSTLGIPQERGKEQSVNNTTERVGKMSVAAVALGGGAYFLREFFRRRTGGVLEDEVRRVLGTANATTEELVSDLQLQNRSGNVNEDKRQTSLRQLIKMRTQHHGLENVLSRLEPFMDEKTKKFQQKKR